MLCDKVIITRYQGVTVKLSTVLIAVTTSAVMGVLFGLLLPVTSMIVYVVTGVNIDIER